MNGIMTVIVSTDKDKLKQQIRALKSVMVRDTNDKDKMYHQLALDTLQKAIDEN